MEKIHAFVQTAFGRALTLLKSEEGQGATEYAMVIAFLVIGLTVTLGVLGTDISTFLGKVGTKLDGLLP
jgi:Flp pilus assembly pilin Flp